MPFLSITRIPLADTRRVTKRFSLSTQELLLSRDVTSALINLGGNVLAVGARPDGTPFQIGLQEPFLSTAPLPPFCLSPIGPWSLQASMNDALNRMVSSITIFWIQRPAIPFIMAWPALLSSPLLPRRRMPSALLFLSRFGRRKAAGRIPSRGGSRFSHARRPADHHKRRPAGR